MRKKIFALMMAALLIAGMFCGCSQKEKPKDIESTSEEDGSNYYISFGDIEKEEFVQELKSLDIEEQTLLIGVNTVYSEKAVGQLNELLKEEGYDFNVILCRIPDKCLYGGVLLEFFQYLKEEKVGVDVLPIWNISLVSAVESGFLTDISGFLEGEATLKESFPKQFWELTAVDGKNYGMGTLYTSPKSWAVNKELMVKYGLTQEELAKEITELEEVFRTVSAGENTPDFAAFVHEPRFFLESIPFVYVDKSLPIGYWYEEKREENLVVNLFDTNKMETLVGTMNRYYEEGYIKIANDIPLQTSFFMHMDYNGFPIQRSDSLDTWNNLSGIELVRVPYYQQTTYELGGMLSAIPSWSEKKEEAWEFLSFVYGNKEASTLLRYGIEGEDYSISENTVVAGEGLSENEIYNRSLGNSQLTAPLFPYEDAEKTVLIEEGLNDLQDSFLAGFVFDTAPVQNEVDAVRNLYMELSTFRIMFAFEGNEEYENWQEFYEAYKNELKNAGIERIVDEMNRQIQEYLKK